MADKAEKAGLFTRLKAAFQDDQWTPVTQSNMYDDGSTTGGWTYPYLGNYLSIYKSSNAVRSVISFKAENAAAIPLKVYRRIDDDVREALYDHGLSITLRDPNTEQTAYTLIRDLYTDLYLFDVTFWKKIRTRGRLLLVRMYPDAVTMYGGNTLSPSTFIEQQSSNPHDTKEYKRSDIFWLHGYGGRRGISPMETLRRELEMDDIEVQARGRSAKSGWRNAGVIQRPADAPEWDDIGRARFLEQTTARYTGDGELAGRPLLLEEGMEYRTDESPSGQSEYMSARSLTIKQVCLAFHLAPQLMGVEAAPFSSIVEYFNQLYKGALSNDFTFVEQESNKQLVPEFDDQEGVYSEFNIDARLRGDPAQQAAIAATAVGGPYMTVNEWRAKVLNLDPIAGGDELIRPGGAPSGGGFGDAFGQGPLVDEFGNIVEGEPSAGELPAFGFGPPAPSPLQGAPRPTQKAELHFKNETVDDSKWDGDAALSRAVIDDNPTQAFGSICAGKIEGEDPTTKAAWRLPHHSHPGGPPNKEGVQLALGRVDQAPISNTEGARRHLEAHRMSFENVKHHGPSLGEHYHPHALSHLLGRDTDVVLQPEFPDDFPDWLKEPHDPATHDEYFEQNDKIDAREKELARRMVTLRELSQKYAGNPKFEQLVYNRIKQVENEQDRIGDWYFFRGSSKSDEVKHIGPDVGDHYHPHWMNGQMVGAISAADLEGTGNDIAPLDLGPVRVDSNTISYSSGLIDGTTLKKKVEAARKSNSVTELDPLMIDQDLDGLAHSIVMGDHEPAADTPTLVKLASHEGAIDSFRKSLIKYTKLLRDNGHINDAQPSEILDMARFNRIAGFLDGLKGVSPRPGPKSDDDADLEVKAEIGGGEFSSARDRIKDALELKLIKLYSVWENEFASKGEADKTQWVQGLTGELHLASVDGAAAIGEMAALRTKGEYDKARTVNYWQKVSKAHAVKAVENLLTALEASESTRVWDTLRGNVGHVASTLASQASGWGLMEFSRQNGYDNQEIQ